MAYHREEEIARWLESWAKREEGNGSMAKILLAPRDAMPDVGVTSHGIGQDGDFADRTLRLMAKHHVVALLDYHFSFNPPRPSWWVDAWRLRVGRKQRARYVEAAHHEFCSVWSGVKIDAQTRRDTLANMSGLDQTVQPEAGTKPASRRVYAKTAPAYRPKP